MAKKQAIDDVEMEDVVEPVKEEITTEEIMEAMDAASPDPEIAEDDDTPPELELDGGEPEPEPEPEIEKEVEPEPETETEKKPSDEFGKIDKDAPEKTRERFETVKTRYDELAKERDTLVADRDKIIADTNQWRDAIQSTGTNSAQFEMAMNWLTKVNAGDTSSLQEAYDIMSNELEAVGKLLGKSAGGKYNPLDDYPDLKERVDSGLLDESDAMELVASRASQKLNESRQQKDNDSARFKGSVDKALADVKMYGESMQAKDPSFKAKMPFLIPIIQSISKAAPNNPETWMESVKAAYENMPDFPTVAPVQQIKPVVPNSIRQTAGGSPVSNHEKEPGSLEEAVDLALARGY